MARKNDSAALATTNEGASLAVDDMAALAAAFDFDFTSTGLDEIDREDLRFAAKIWNMTMKKPGSENEFMVKNEFFDTLTEKTQRELFCVFVTLHKTNEFSYYDNTLEETVRVCTSYDRVTGVLRAKHPKLTMLNEGDTRSCEKCPDAQWQKDEKGKNVRNCAPSYNVIAIEMDPQGNMLSPFMIRFKKTGLAPFKTHLQKHHIGRMKDRSGRAGNVPLYAYGVRITLQMDEKGKYAFPVIERGGILPREMLKQLDEQVKYFEEISSDVTRVAETQETKHGADVVETKGETLSSSDYTD